jgi:L-cystine transport system ATP-binding protein
VIELRNIHKSFGKLHVLKGIDLSIAKGEVVVILGPSGSGKTTLLRCINFLEHADEGEVVIDGLGVNCKHSSKKEIQALRQKTAMVFQQFNLFKNKTALENVIESLIVVGKIPKETARQTGLDLLSSVGLSDKINSYPSELSGGQQQRVGIARALAVNPQVMLFDEPTSALDPELKGEVLAAIKRVAQQGMTMVIVTHEVKFACDTASRIVFMDGGVVVEEGLPADVIYRCKEDRTKQFMKNIASDGTYAGGVLASADVVEES